MSPESFSARAHRVIPGGAHTYSKGDDQLPVNAPRGFVRGKGARVWDLDGKEFVDWGMGINSVLIGHAEDAIDEAAIAALRGGQNLSRPGPLEVDTAEALVALFDGMDMVKFGKNGSDANEAAIRLARAVTGRDLIAYDADAPFLSIHDWFIGTTVMNAGVPASAGRMSVPFRYNDVGSIEAVFAQQGSAIAAVLLEPVRTTAPAPGFLAAVRSLCDRHGALLIFDENVTGFRLSLHGAYSLFGVSPDLITLGKGMANGYALSAVAGRREYMERGGLAHSHPRCFLLSTTNGAERSALAACGATIGFYQDHDVTARLTGTGQLLMSGFLDIAREQGIERLLFLSSDFPARPMLACLDHNGAPSPEHRTLFLQEMLKAGVFMPWVCPSFRHGASEMDQTLSAFGRACTVYRRAIEAGSVAGLLAGPAVKPVFRQYN